MYICGLRRGRCTQDELNDGSGRTPSPPNPTTPRTRISHQQPRRDRPFPTRRAAPPATRHRTPLLGISIALVAILAGSGLFLSGYSLGRQAAAEPGTAPSDEAAFQPFWDTYHTISDRYAGGEIDRGELVQGAIKGMIDSLGDPFSQYLSADQYHQSLQTISGQFEGIGADLGSQAADGTQGCDPLGTACRLLVTKSFDGSPAARAGLIAGDIVLSVDGTSLDGLTVDAARTMIRGPKGSMVTLGVQRGSATPGAFGHHARRRSRPSRSAAGTSPPGLSATCRSPASRTSPPTRSWRP